MEESEFQKHMESAKLGTQMSVAGPSSPQGLATSTRGLQKQIDAEGLFLTTFSSFETDIFSINLDLSYQLSPWA